MRSARPFHLRELLVTTAWPVALGLVLVTCDGSSEDPPLDDTEQRYDLICPAAGSACANADGALLVGVGVRDITPVITEPFDDCGLDGICPWDAGYPGADEGEMDGDFQGDPYRLEVSAEKWHDANGNGLFDAVWIAGYGNTRPAQGVHDPVEARAVVLRKGDTTLALVTVDLIGYFYDEVKRIREELGNEAGVDLLLVSASHTHEGPDSVGIWGYNEATTGVDPKYMKRVRAEIIEAVKGALLGLEPATVIAATGIPEGHPDPAVVAGIGINNLLDDGRDPVVMDEEMRLLQFRRVTTGTTIATLINWANHPESLSDQNAYISSDFVHYLRRTLESGVDRDGYVDAGEGGIALYFNGAVGGMQSPGGIQIIDLDGAPLMVTSAHTTSPDDPFFDRPRAFGQLAGLDALRILREQGEELTDVDLSFASKAFMVPVENRGYHAMFITGVFYGACEYDKFGTVVPRRCIYDFDEEAQLTEENRPSLETEVSLINIGEVQMLTAPGEVLPELFVGGYDGSHVGPVQDLIDGWHNREHGVAAACANDTACGTGGDAECAGLEIIPGRVCSDSNCCCIGGTCRDDDYNPPDLTLAPGPPYLKDRMTGRFNWLLGLTPDELGYIIPAYNYKVDDRLPYLEDAPGHHYEETNSVGGSITALMELHLDGLLEALP